MMPGARLHGPLGARLLLAAVVLSLLAFGAACSSKSSPTGTGGSSSPATSSMPSTTATVTILYPTGGAVVTGTTLEVKARLDGAILVQPGQATGSDPGQGHLHIIIDGATQSMTSCSQSMCPSGSIATQDVPVTPGQHILEVEFVANNHQSFNPKDLQSVHFSVASS